MTIEVRITKLRQHLLTLDIPDYQVAGACGIHHTKLSNYAQGKADFSPPHLKALSEYFHCPPEELMGWVVYYLDEDDNIIGTADEA